MIKQIEVTEELQSDRFEEENEVGRVIASRSVVFPVPFSPTKTLTPVPSVSPSGILKLSMINVSFEPNNL